MLYRLLIEIRRENGGVGCAERRASNSIRNNARQLKISYTDHSNWGYLGATKGEQANLKVCFDAVVRPAPADSDTEVASTGIGNPVPVNTLYTLATHPYNPPCALCHEMLHWYQQLRNPVRYGAECQKLIANIANNGLSADLGYPIAPAAVRGDFLSWDDDDAAGNEVIKLDEMRVICGAENGHNCQYWEGDDLSENAFRCSLGLKMRFGHDGVIPLANAIAAPATQHAIEIAHGWALRCVQNILLGLAPVNWWDLTPGGALWP